MSDTVARVIARLKPRFALAPIPAEQAAELMTEPDPGFTRIDTWNEEHPNDAR